MSRSWCRVKPADEQILVPVHVTCPECGRVMRIRYSNHRAIVSLRDLVRVRLKIRRCETRTCGRYHQAWRPEAEAALALPQHEFGLDVIALAGALRYREHRSVPEIHQELSRRGVAICERSVLLERYDELVAASAGTATHRAALERQGRVILAIDGLQPDVGHEVLWVIRECLSGLVLLARALLSSACDDLTGLLREVAADLAALGVPVDGAVSDGQHSIRLAIARVWPDVPHQLCHFHYLREAALPVYEADRHAKKELKKVVRGVRPIERTVEGRTDEAARVVQGYCAAVRGALTDDGPLEACGCTTGWRRSRPALAGSSKRGAPAKGVEEASVLARQGSGPDPDAVIRRSFRWAAARILKNTAGPAADDVKTRYTRLLAEWRDRRETCGTLGDAVDRFLKVTDSYRPGLFHYLRVPGLPPTNNGLEQFFGAQRHQERRATGRKVASPSLVVRGSVRVLAATLTRLAPVSAADLAAVDVATWRQTRERLKRRHHARVMRARFRRNPAAYLGRPRTARLPAAQGNRVKPIKSFLRTAVALWVMFARRSV